MGISFGKGKTYPWSSTYWSTKTNVKTLGVNSGANLDDSGWVMLADASNTWSNTWANLTGWTTYSVANSSNAVSGGILTQYAQTTNVGAYVYKDLMTPNYVDVWTQSMPMKVTAMSINAVGHTNNDQGNTKQSAFGYNQKTNSSGVLQYWTGSTKADTTFVPDTGYHIYTIQMNGTVNRLLIDGIQYASTMRVIGIGGKGTIQHSVDRQTGDPNKIEQLIGQFDFVANSSAQFATADGIIESDINSDVFDAGVGKHFSTVLFTRDTSNSTSCTIYCRCASSRASLANASYETIATSGDNIQTTGRYGQLKAILQDSGSGKDTPLLKTLEFGDAVDDPITFIPQIIMCN